LVSVDALAGVWRYRDWLPLAYERNAVSLGEGGTPLIRLNRWAGSIGLEEVYAKLEFAGPTGSFKDRGAAVLMSHAMEIGARTVVEDSSGNAGAAFAAYAARAGLECIVYVPSATPAAKLQQMQACGARVVTVDGGRDRVAAAAQEAAREGRGGAYYAGHNSNPYFVEGMKTFAFELIDQLPARPAEHIVMPVGGGSLYCGTALGFNQMHEARLSTSSPRMHLVQSTACMPIVAAFEEGGGEPLPVRAHPTIAGGIVIANPHRGRLILRILHESGAAGVGVTDDEIRRAQQELARREGLLMEPTSAAAFAGLTKLARDGAVQQYERVVVPVTGSGLKDLTPVSDTRP
jgi:threonine synthase